MTILDSDEEEEEVVAKPSNGNGKGKEKAKIQEITLSDSEDEGSDASDEYMPSPKKGRQDESGEEEEMGQLADSDEEETKPSKKPLLAQGDFRSSTKLEALAKSLQAAKEKDPKLKAVVFSQVRVTRLLYLDLADLLLPSSVHRFPRLDRASTQQRRLCVRSDFTLLTEELVSPTFILVIFVSTAR